MYEDIPKSNRRMPVVRNFWYQTDTQPDPTLYKDQLGWSIELKVESGGYTDTYDVWLNLMEDCHIRGIGWDLCFFYPPTRSFYYINQIDRYVSRLPIREDWDGKYILNSVDIEPQIVPEENELMDFNEISEVWNNFKIDGKDMKYILEHSVVFLST
jgi:hypothetical protein